MTSIVFQQPILARHSNEATLMPFTEFTRSSPAIMQLVLDGKQVPGCLAFDKQGFLRTVAIVEFVHLNNSLAHVVVNLSDEELCLGKLDDSITKHFLCLRPRTDVPPAAVKGEVVNDTVRGQIMQGQAHVMLHALSMIYPIKGGKKWIDGHASDTEVQDDVLREYGAEALQWVQAGVHAIEHADDIAAVYHAALRTPGALEACLGPDFPKLRIHGGNPMVDMIPITSSTHPDETAKGKTTLGPYKLPPAPAKAPAAEGGLTADLLTRICTSKEERMSESQMKDGEATASGVFIGGTIDLATGKISVLALPKPTDAYEKCCKATSSKLERGMKIKRMLDTNNKARPPGSIHATCRQMPDADIELAKGFVSGSWAKAVMTTFVGKKTNCVSWDREEPTRLLLEAP